MIPFLSFFAVVALLTLFSGWRSAIFIDLRNELLPQLNFEPFVYLFLVIAGMRIFFSFGERLFNGVKSNFYLPFSGALGGWSFGLTLGLLFHGEWCNALRGFILTVFVVVFCLSPLLLSHLAIKQANDTFIKFFPKKYEAAVVYIVGICFITIGTVGLVRWWLTHR